MIQEMPQAVEALAQFEGKSGHEDTKKDMERAIESAELAKKEVASDFQILRATLILNIWASLENLVKSMVVARAVNDRSWIKADAIKSLKVPIGEYMSMSVSERAWFLADQIEQSKSSSLKLGVNRFESLLESIGLSGAVLPEIAKNIYELQQLRNAIAHRNGVVDRRLKKACPWLKQKVGSKIHISSEQVNNHHVQAIRYLTEIIYRIGDQDGVDLRGAQRRSGS